MGRIRRRILTRRPRWRPRVKPVASKALPEVMEEDRLGEEVEEVEEQEVEPVPE